VGVAGRGGSSAASSVNIGNVETSCDGKDSGKEREKEELAGFNGADSSSSLS
jgi:hypothetical protein